MFGRLVQRFWLLPALVLQLGGCGASEPSLCSSLPGTAKEMAATPRENENLELLALRLSAGVTAEESVYRRLVRDITAIRAGAPAIRRVNYSPRRYVQGLYVVLDDASFREFQAGKYRAWECLNRHYGATSMSSSTHNGVSLEFKGRLNMEVLAELYGKVAGVRLAEPVRPIGEAPTIHVTPEADTWHYVFDHASGDCPAGCTEHDAYYFRVAGDGEPRFAGRWESAGNSGPRPDWVDRYMRR